MKKKHKLVQEKINDLEPKHKDACNLTQSDINHIDCKKCNCEYKKTSYRAITWIFLFVLSLLIAVILTLVLVDILYH